jgi:hypothetical protein
VYPAGVSLGESFHFAVGDIDWMINPNAADPTKIDYQISGQVPGTAPVLEIGTL